MKPVARGHSIAKLFPFSALGRAVWDETRIIMAAMVSTPLFQCSRSSRMG